MSPHSPRGVKEDTAGRERVRRNRSIHAGSRPFERSRPAARRRGRDRLARDARRRHGGLPAGGRAPRLLRPPRRSRRRRPLGAAETLDERAAQIGDAEALVLIRERTPIDEALLALLPDLRLICQTGRGMPHIDVEACTRRGIAVCTGSGSPYAPAELTLALILASTRLPRRRRRRASRRDAGRRRSAASCTAACSGSSATARSARSSPATGARSGCTSLAWGREGSLERARADGHEPEPDLDALCARSDVVSLHLKLSPETRGLVTARHLGADEA